MAEDVHKHQAFEHGGRRFSVRWGNLLISKRQASEMTPEEAASLLSNWATAPDYERNYDRSGFVYLAHMPATGHYKIGYSKKPAARVDHFDVQMPVDVNLIHSFPADDAHACEKLIHAAMEPWLVEGTKEWFTLPGGQALLIKYYRAYENGQVVIDPAEVPDMLREFGELPSSEIQPHPEAAAQAERWREKRDQELRERTDWPELESALPVSKPILKKLFSHIRSALSGEGCNNELTHTLDFARANVIPDLPLVAWLQEWGGFCDCEVVANVAEMWEWRL